MQARLLVTEAGTPDDVSIRSGLELLGHRVDTAVDRSQLLLLAGINPYDAIILDVTVPSIGDFSIVRELRERCAAAQVMVLSAPGPAEKRVQGLEAGADDCLTKPVQSVELVARVRALLRRKPAQVDKSLQVADLVLDLITQHASRGGWNIALTRREFDLLESLMRASPQPVSKDSLIDQVWRKKVDYETNVVNVYIRSLRRKIDRKPLQPLIHTVRNVGYCCKTLLG